MHGNGKKKTKNNALFPVPFAAAIVSLILTVWG